MGKTFIVPVIFRGGLNLSATLLDLTAGECRQLHNYEINTLGKYQRILGYERFDGRPAPSDVKPSMLEGYPFPNDASELLAINAARALRRNNIQPVPGSGRILGCFVFGAFVYAFRNTEDGSAAKLWRSSLSGWTEVPTPALLPGGRYETLRCNFSGSAGGIEVVGCDGVNPAFRFDGSTFTQITTSITPNAPRHLQVLPSQVLLLAFAGGSLLYSAVGDPTKWSPVDGGGELAVSDEIVGMTIEPDNSCAVFCRNKTYVLYGRSRADFNLTTLSMTTGAIEWSIQSVAGAIYMDDRGLTRLNRVQAFGNFDAATISQAIEPLLRGYVGRAVGSFVVKRKNQYRLCFEDGGGVILTFAGQDNYGFSTFSFGKTIRCVTSDEDAAGREVIYFGSDDGYLYQAEKGFSFDGLPYTDVMRPAFTDLGAPDINKRWFKTVVECETPGRTTLTMVPDFDFSSPENAADQPKYLEVFGGGGYWDQATWDETTWSAASAYTADIYMDGVGRNMSLLVTSTSDSNPPHILRSMLIHAAARGRRR